MTRKPKLKTMSKWNRTAAKEGRETAKTGQARKSPYDGIEALKHLSPSWYSGYDGLHGVLE